MLPETFLAINYIFAVGRICTNDVFFAFVAGSLVKLPLVAQRQTSFLPALRAIFRPRQILLFIEFLLLNNNQEVFSALLTSALFVLQFF